MSDGLKRVIEGLPYTSPLHSLFVLEAIAHYAKAIQEAEAFNIEKGRLAPSFEDWKQIGSEFLASLKEAGFGVKGDK